MSGGDVVALWCEGGEEAAPTLRALLPRLARQHSAEAVLADRCRDAAGFLAEASDVSSRLAALLRPSFGPDAALRATVDMVGQVSFTANGAKLVQKGRGDHPVARWILRALTDWQRAAGDGTTRWTLLCDGVLRRLREAPRSLLGHRLSLAARAAAESLPDALQPEDAQRLGAEDCVGAAARAVIGTCCGDDACRVLCDGLRQLARVSPDVEELLRDPHSRVVGLAGGGLRNSRIVRGCAVAASSRTPQLRPALTPDSRVAVLRRPLLPPAQRTAASDSDSSSDGAVGAPVSLDIDAGGLRDYRRLAERRCVRFADRMHRAGVVLLVAQGTLPDAAVGALLARRISVFDGVSAADSRRLVAELGADAVDPWAGEESCGNWAVQLRSAEAVRGRPELLIVASARTAPRHTLVITSPSAGLAADYAELCCRALVHARWALPAGWVPGAGADLLAAAAAARKAAGSGNAASSAVLAAVSDALEETVVTCAANTAMSRHAARRLVADARGGRCGIVSMLRLPDDADAGRVEGLAELRDPAAFGILEPACMAAELVRSVLTAVAGLLRVDGVALARSAAGSQHVREVGMV